jgi:Ca-activated chloride channel homolog
MKITRFAMMLAAVALVTVVAAPSASAAGLLMPNDTSLPPLAVKFLRVDAVIDNQAATTHVTQEFLNSTDRPLECTYIFPLPKGAAIREFAMYIDGKRQTGELLEKDKARSVYEEIVRRAKDPGLLEYMDGSLLRMKIFPVPAKGTQKIEIEYSELIPLDSGLAEYVFPLKVGDKASRTLDDFTVSVKIKSSAAIKSVYSPTHDVGIARPSDHEAVAGMETKKAVLDHDFHLFYTLSEKDFGLSLMTYRPEADKPGMFLVLLSPKTEIDDSKRVPRDVVFVLDTSGSMKDGGKIQQVKKALAFCLGKLDPKDRFAVVQFSTTAQTFADKWTEASEANGKKAQEWAEKFEAGGGTNVSEALQTALGLPTEEGRLTTVMFLTDGQPTVGVTDPPELLKKVKENNKRGLRIFTFGVGDDVNTHLLDRMANDTGGLPEYVRDTEAVDGKVTRLFSKMSYPVLTDLALEIPGVKVTEMFPKQPPDLFRGSQVVVLGTYEGSGPSAIRLKGQMGKKAEEYVYEGNFAAKSADRTFIGPLYAHRKIGFLLDQIRLHGENKELKDEVVRLSLAYGIETPYTSYLVLENDQQYKQYGIERAKGADRVWAPAATGPAAAPAGEAAMARIHDTYSLGKSGGGSPSLLRGDATPAAQPATRPAAPDMSYSGGTALGALATNQGDKTEAAGLRASLDALRNTESGKEAVDIATAVRRMREATTDKDIRGVRTVQEKGGRRYMSLGGVWVDERFQGTEKLTKIKWGSEAYFRLARDKADLRDAFALGQRIVVVTARGQAIAVDADEGEEKLSDDAFKALFTEAPAEKPAKVEEKPAK